MMDHNVSNDLIDCQMNSKDVDDNDDDNWILNIDIFSYLKISLSFLIVTIN